MTDPYPYFALHISCVNGAVASYISPESRPLAFRELINFLRKMDHEGADWTVEETLSAEITIDITEEVRKLYESPVQ